MAQRTRHHRPGLCFAATVSLLALLLCLPSGSTAAEFLDPAHPLHTRLAVELADGRITRSDALMQALRAVFEPASGAVPDVDPEHVPLRCATTLIRSARKTDSGLSAAQIQQLDQWTDFAQPARRASNIYLSSAGHFAIDYLTTGADSVSTTDTTPANGIPDFVDQVGVALEFSWTTQVDQLGFDPPDTGGVPYEVLLRSIGSYGTTELSPGSPGGTRIILRNNYDGLPANEDPDGSAIGALRVSAAHELRHAGQFATSAWSETGLWIELDAVWMEDQVYDQVNDYYRFLSSNSPISSPWLPLDDGGSASYPECIFEHWIEARLGVDGIRQYWERRRAMPGEQVIDSYDAVLTSNLAPLETLFTDFALFNLQTGSLAQPTNGYPEAASYPDATLSETRSSLPASFGSSVDHLAAKLYRVDGFSLGDEDVQVRLRQPAGVQLRVVALTLRNDGVRIEEDLYATSQDTSMVLMTDADRIDELYLVVANGDKGGPAEWFFADVEEIPPVSPDPVVTLSDNWTLLTMATGQTRDLYIELVNNGPASSTLQWTARATDPPPVVAQRSIAGSQFLLDRIDYIPAEIHDMAVGILNGSTGVEFLTGATLELPAGVSVVSGQNLVGESGLVLTYLGFDPPTSTVHWLNLDGGFGSVPAGQTALGGLSLAFDTSLTGPLAFNWTLDGNGFGGAPHQVTGQVVLNGPASPRLEIRCPNPPLPAIIGSDYDITWFAADPSPLTIELSRDDGQSWETLVSDTPNNGFWRWNVTGEATSEARLRLDSGGQLSAVSPRFDVLQPMGWVTMVPATGSLAGRGAINLKLRADATVIPPGDYPVIVDVRDANTYASDKVQVIVRVLASAVDAPAISRNRVLGAWPNPFNPATELRFELAAPARVVAQVLDLRGRRVRALLDTRLEAGPQSVRWDGMDGDGQPVASGTYFWQMQIGTDRFTGKLSLVR